MSREPMSQDLLLELAELFMSEAVEQYNVEAGAPGDHLTRYREGDRLANIADEIHDRAVCAEGETQ